MFKGKFKELIDKKDLVDSNKFEILNDNQMISLNGGCGGLMDCGHFTGSCEHLKSCNVFSEPEK